MEMFFLVFQVAYSVAVMPEKYTKDECEAAKKSVGSYALCVPAPKPQVTAAPGLPHGCAMLGRGVVCPAGTFAP